MSGFFFLPSQIELSEKIIFSAVFIPKPVDMRRSLLVFVALCCVYAVQAQKPMSIKVKDPVICYATAQNHPQYIAPPEEFLNRKNNSARTNATTIEVTYIGFETVPQAQQAFQRAIDIWASLLVTSVPIRIEARWTPLAAGVLGSANYTSAYANFKGAQKLNVFYPVAIAEKITGREMNGADQPDIFANFSSVFDWHFDPNTTPPTGKYDLTTVVLHEIGHGLGFSGSLRVSGTTGLFGLATTAVPIIYDVPIETIIGANLIETIASPSVALAAPLTSGNLFFDAPSGLTKLYAPTPYNGGSSISHLDESTYNSSSDALMTPFIAAQEQQNNPGLAFKILKDLGWETILILHQKLAGTENVAGPYTVTATIDADNGYKEGTVKLHYTIDGTTFTIEPMMPSGPAHTFSANIPSSGAGNYGYFISVENEEDVESVNPGKRVRPLQTQLQNLYIFEVGPDTRAPIIAHEQQPFLLDTETELQITAEIFDNTGSVTAVVEYFINDVQQADMPLSLIAPEEDSVYTVAINIASLVDGDQIKYRIKATDHSANQNIAFSPAEDYYILNVVGYGPTQDNYQNDFETANNDGDFFGVGYSIMKPSGFNDRAIHSEHPYTSGDGFPGNERNLIYQLRIPIRVKAQEATIKFDEIALVEAGASGSVFGSNEFFDYVIIEGSKDGGQTWEFLLPGYDARAQSVWLTRYNSAIDNITGNSTAVGDPTLYKPRIINLLQTFVEGDEVVIRFRMYIDQLSNAWGWAINNLKIQIDETPPVILHDHLDYVTSSTNLPGLGVVVTDASEFGDVVLNYRLNTNEIVGSLTASEVSSGQTIPFVFPVEEFSAGDTLEYNITVTDAFGNIATLPSEGFIRVPFFTPASAVTEYHNNFNAETTDFIGNFFSLNTPSGFDNGAIQTNDPYPLGFGLDSTSYFTFTLKTPITISASNSIIRFDEIVLVEGHTNGVVFGTDAFNDYTIVEGSKDNGETWIPFADGYDAVGVAGWVNAVNNNAAGNKNLFQSRTINMKTSGDFNTGDNVLIRFRLFSNETINSRGWTIDNLYIQNPITGIETLADAAISIYPNPTQGNLTVEAEAATLPEFTIELISTTGQKIYQATQTVQNGKMVHTIPSQGFPAGMYLVKISNGSQSTAQKVIKVN